MAAIGVKAMRKYRKFCNMFVIICLGFVSVVTGVIQEYCSEDEFQPRCSNGEVIIMSHAVYGRMKLGKCITQNIGIGCQSDVLSIFDEKCSNKQHCEVHVHSDLNKNSDIRNPCPLEILRYLEADYYCKKVLQVQPSQCHSPSHKFEVTTSLSIASDILVNSRCGSSTQYFTSRPGQRLNVTIIDFNWDESHDSARSCINYLELTDVSSSKTTPVCAGTKRKRHVLACEGSELMAVFHIQDPRNQRFLLQFEAVGCGDISPPEGTWVQRDGDETTLGCHSGKHTWTLTCQHNQWVGAVGSCGTAFKVEKVISESSEAEEVSIAPGMVAFAVCAVFLFICSSVFTIGVCIYTSRYPGKKSEQSFHAYPLLSGTTNMNHPPVYPGNHTSKRLPQNTQFQNQMDIEYSKSLLTDRKVGLQPVLNRPEDDQIYFNRTNSQADSLYSDSVKYYVLENPKDTQQT